LNDKIAYKDFDAVKNNLPEGFLQRRIIKTDVKTLKYIIEQRKNHRLKEWQQFCKEINEMIKWIKEHELPEF
jgi:prephenate dehydrogenase